MDPTGLIDAVLAVVVYPGAAFVTLAALLHRAVAGRPIVLLQPVAAVPAVSLLPALAATLAVTMLPFAHSPALVLPPEGGVGANLVAVAALLAVAVDLGTASRAAAVFATSAALPLLALAATTGTLDVRVIAAAGGSLGTGARACAAALLLLAAAAISGRRVAAVVAAALALSASALVVPAALPGSVLPGLVVSLALVAVAGLLSRLPARWSAPVLAVVSTATAVAGTTMALLLARG